MDVDVGGFVFVGGFDVLFGGVDCVGVFFCRVLMMMWYGRMRCV